jgi:N-dimethylarginine dimethylaminohydrolase
MWTVESECGRLNAVLIQESIDQFWENKLPFTGIESNSHYLARCPHATIDGGKEQWQQLPKFLERESVQVFEVTSILERILEGATLGERRRIVNEIWESEARGPNADDLTVKHLLRGYPSKPFYNSKADRVILPDFQRVGWPYPRDTSFTTQVGTVISKMRRYSRKFEPNIVRLLYKYDPILCEQIEIVYDANQEELGSTEPFCVEGGDTHIVDEETITIGIGQRTTYTGFIETVRRLFEADINGVLKYICAVKLPSYPAIDYMHLDAVINYLDRGRALVMPYFFKSKLVKDMPPKRLLLKTLEAVRAQAEKDNRPMDIVIHPNDFIEAGMCFVYGRGSKGPVLLKRLSSLIDFLVEEGKLESDGFVYVGGYPDKENDVEHLIQALMEQARGATNIFAVKSGSVIAYERNHVTNEELRKHGIRVMEWDDSYLDMLGGPHCSTSPLWRDPC